MFLCVWWRVPCVYCSICVYSQAVAIAVCEGRFGELHHSGAALPDDLGGAAQQLLGFCEGLSQLLLPLHELGVALQTGNTKLSRIGCSRGRRGGAVRRSYLTLQHELLPSFDTQQDAFLVFNLGLFHSNNLLHRQQVLLRNKLIANKPKPRNAENGARWVNSGLQEIIFLSRPTLKRLFWTGPGTVFDTETQST